MEKFYEYMEIEPVISCCPPSTHECIGVTSIECKNCTYAAYEYHEKDGNLMVLAISTMRDKKEINDFYACSFDEYRVHTKPDWDKERDGYGIFFTWLFENPQKFFELMEAWLNEKTVS